MGERTFPGDPNPPATPPAGNYSSSGAEPADTPLPVVAPDSEAAAPASSASPFPRVSFRVFNDVDSGRPELYMNSDDGEQRHMGPVLIENATETLNAIATYDPSTRSWDVPEAAVKDLLKGDLPLPAYIRAKYRAGKADLTRSLIGLQYLQGDTDRESAQARGNLELLAVQEEAPLFKWQGGLGKTVAKVWEDLKTSGVKGVAKRATGEAAQLLPMMMDVGGEAAKDSMVLGGGAAAIAAATLGTAGAATPAAVAAVSGMFATGETFGVLKRSAELEAASTAMDMIDKGFDDKTIKVVAPVAGAFKGALEVMGFKFLTAPIKRKIIGEVVTSGVFKKALYNYVKETAGEVSTEVGQTLIDNVANNLAAQVEEKPELADSPEKIIDDVVNTVLTAGAGMGVVHLPGAALDLTRGPKMTKSEKAQAAEVTKDIETYKQEVAAEKPAPAKPAGEEAAAVEPGAQETTPSASEAPEPAAPQMRSVEEQMRELVDGNEKGVYTDEQMADQADRLLAQLDEEPSTGAAPEPTKLEAATHETQVKARIADLEGQLSSAQGFIDDLIRLREEKFKKLESTAKLDAVLKDRLQERAALKQDLDFYRSAEAKNIDAVTRRETLSLKPATLERIVELGFKEGRKDVIKNRAVQVKNVADTLGLSEADVRKLLKNKNIGLMGDVEFKHWLEDGAERKNSKTGEVEHIPSFREQAAALAQRKAAIVDLKVEQRRKQIKKEHNLRALHGLPAIGKMTTEQIRQYIGVLRQYDKGDEVLSAKRIKALETTPLSGVKTMREAVARAARILNRPLSEVARVLPSQLDIFAYDSKLATRSAFHQFMVEQLKIEQIKADAKFMEVKQKINELGAKAAASRPRGVLGFLAPQMKEVVTYLEAEDGPAKQEAAAALTPEEMEFAAFLEDAYAHAYMYLAQVENLESRFEDKYFYHAARPVSEILSDIVHGETAFKDAVREMWNRATPDEAFFKVTTSTGQALGLRKFMKQTLFRSGELTPSKNVIRSSSLYFQQFYKKVALDAAIPHIETLAMALRSQDVDKSEGAEMRHNALEKFVKQYLNAKKGQSVLQDVVPQGGKVDVAIRAASNLVSALYVAVNIPLQVASIAGDSVAQIAALGTPKWLLANKRSLTKKGREILAHYKGFTGEGALEQLLEPGKNIEERAGTAAYFLFQALRAHMMGNLILANMTAEEFETGKISDEKLARIKIAAGRFLDIQGSKSVFGSTSTGAALTKFRGWAIPIMTTVKDDALALARRVAKGEPLNEQVMTDVANLAQVAAVMAAVTAWAGNEEDIEDDTFEGKMRKYAVRELSTILQALRPGTVLTTGAVVAFLERLSKNLDLLGQTYEKDTPTHDEGDNKGTAALKKQFTPAVVKQFQDKEDE